MPSTAMARRRDRSIFRHDIEQRCLDRLPPDARILQAAAKIEHRCGNGRLRHGHDVSSALDGGDAHAGCADIDAERQARSCGCVPGDRKHAGGRRLIGDQHIDHLSRKAPCRT